MPSKQTWKVVALKCCERSRSSIKIGVMPDRRFVVRRCPICFGFAAVLPVGATGEWFYLATLGNRDDAGTLALYGLDLCDVGYLDRVRAWAEAGGHRGQLVDLLRSLREAADPK